MRFLFIIAMLFFWQNTLLARVTINCSFIDSANKLHYGFMETTDLIKIQEKATILTDSFDKNTYLPIELKAFTIFFKKDTVTYNSLYYGNKRYFLRLQQNGAFLQEYAFYTMGRRVYKVRALLFKGDENIMQNTNEGDSTWIARAFADYPVLSEMAKKNMLDALQGYEGSLVFDEYNRWKTDTAFSKFSDTSITLKAIIDADRNYKSKIYFWICRVSFFATFPLAFIPDFTAIIMGGAEPRNANLGIKNKSLFLNTAYLKAYKLRAHTKKFQNCIKAVFLD